MATLGQILNRQRYWSGVFGAGGLCWLALRIVDDGGLALGLQGLRGLRGFGATGKAPAEHGSALRLCPLPLAAGQGEGWGGVVFRPLDVAWLAAAHRAIGLLGTALPSMARHFAHA